MPQERQYEYYAEDKAKGVRYGWDGSRWVTLERIKPESALTKVGRGAALGAFSGAGIAESTDPIGDTLKGLREQLATIAKFWTLKPEDMKASVRANPVVAIPAALASGTSDLLQDVGFKRTGRFLAWEKPKDFDIEKLSHDVASLGTQLLMLKGGRTAAETSPAKGIVGRTAKEALLEASKAGKKTVARAESEAATEAAARRAKRAEEVAEQRRGYEERKAKQMAKHEADVAEAKAKHEAAHDVAEQKLAAGTTKEASSRWYNARLDRAKQTLTRYRDRLVQEATSNIANAEKTERGSLDSRWAQFNKMVSSLKANLSKVGDAVVAAEKDDIKGSRENIKVFRDVLGRLKDHMVEGADGSLKFLDKQMTGLDQMRGYWQELGDAIYNRDLPFDVRKALERVRGGVDEQIQASILDNYGKQAGGVLIERYEQLKQDWSGYKRVWYDRSSGSPLARILRTIRSPVALHEGVDVSGQVADLLTRKHTGGTASALLRGKTQFGANPALVARVGAVEAKLKSLPKMHETVTEAKPAKWPTYEPPKEPDIDPFEPRGKEPDIEPFSREAYRRKRVNELADRLKAFGFSDPLFLAAILAELFRGEPWGAAGAGAYPLARRGLGHLLDKPSVLNWLSRGE